MIQGMLRSGQPSSRRWLGLIVLALIAAATSLMPGYAGAVTFRWANTGDAQSMDPHGHNEAFTLGMQGNVYDGLIGRDKDLKIIPMLATSWKRTDPLTWELSLRRGVKFHDGSDFTAQDVVFSWERASSKGSDMIAYFTSVKSVEAKDPYTVIIRTREFNPILLSDLSIWRIMSKSWTEKNNSVPVTNVATKTEVFATRNANGTGAYILVSREADVKTVFKKNPDWWGWKSGLGTGNVDEVIFTPIKQDGTRVAALLSGGVDMLYELPLQDLDRVKSAGNTIFQMPEIRAIFLGFDHYRDELIDSNVKGKNPFKDKRVRLALYKAIDEDSIASRIMKGAATPANGYLVKEAAGFDGSFKRYAYNPDEAKKLLADAGYPNGFEVGFDCPNDRYVNDAQICQAVAAMWARIGVKANLNAQTKSLHFAKLGRYETSIYMLGWAPGTVDGLNVLDNLLMTKNDASGFGRFNYGRYSNPEVDSLSNQARAELDTEKRTKLLQRALNMAHTDVAAIPLHYQQLFWAAKPNVSLAQRADNLFFWPWVAIK